MEVQWSHLQQSPAPSREALCGLICKVRAPDLSSTWKRLACVIFHQISISQKQKISRYLHLPFSMAGSSRLCCSGNLPIISQLAACASDGLESCSSDTRKAQTGTAKVAGGTYSRLYRFKPRVNTMRVFPGVFSAPKTYGAKQDFMRRKLRWVFCKKKPNVLCFQKSFVSPPSATMGPP